MKIAILIGAALLGTAGVAATPAEAQRYGWNDRGWDDGRGWNDGRRWRDDRRWQGDRRWRGDRNWRGDRRWRGDRGWRNGRRYGWNGGYGRGRIVCRIQRGWYGPERVCFRV